MTANPPLNPSPKILAIKLRQIGDTALWTSALASLRLHIPDGLTDVLVLKGTEKVLEGTPGIRKIHTLERLAFWPLAKKLWELRKQKYDLALGFHATTSLCRLIPLLGAKQKVLHHHSWTFTPPQSDLKIADPGKLENVLLRDHQILKALGYSGNPPATQIFVTEAEKIAARNKMISSAKPRLALLPGARRETHRYPKDLWLKLVQELKLQNKFQLLVICDPELSQLWHLRTEPELNGISLYDDLKLRDLISLLSVCDAAIGNDSGPIHLAIALGLSTTSLFGPANPGDWHPYSNVKNRMIQKEVICRTQGPRDQPAFQYCTVLTCDHHTCLRSISPKEIIPS